MKTTKDNFKLFKDTFIYYQKLFGLTGYTVYFKHEPAGNAYASIHVDQQGMVATVRFNSEADKQSKEHSDIRKTAKHEALHLLLWRIEDRALTRFTLEWEIAEAVEDAVNRLGNLIGDWE